MSIVSEFLGALEFDVCVIGAGPAGIAVALECDAKGLSTLLIEAGGLKPGRTKPTPDDIMDERCHAPLHIATRQSFGGTSWAWGRHCVPFDPIDFETRPYVPESGWPIGYDDMSRWYEAAASYLDCGSSDFLLPASGWEDLDGFSVEPIERMSRLSNFAVAYRDRIERSRRTWLCHGKAVVGLDLDLTGERVVGLRVAGASGPQSAPRARLYVLAGGGLRTTQLLMNLQMEWPQHFCGSDGPLGRYYMGHIGGEIATIVFKVGDDATDFLYKVDAQGIYCLRRFRLDDDKQKSGHMLNTVFMLRTPPLADYRHQSGALSLIHLCALTPALRNYLRPGRMRGAGQDDISVGLGKHLGNVLKNPVATASELQELLRQKFFLKNKVPIVLGNRSGRFALRYNAEQIPSPESRVRLNDRLDRFGAPSLSVDFRFTEEDARSVVRAHEALDYSLQTSARGYLEYWYPPEERLAAVLALASDGYHQVGTTRMRASPRQGVVDPDCRVHGIQNLFIASSSVFPTTGHANPTFPMVALALRLAEHLGRLSSRVRGL
jgi:choline dehydrogenase-like flavoprotein